MKMFHHLRRQNLEQSANQPNDFLTRNGKSVAGRILSTTLAGLLLYNTAGPLIDQYIPIWARANEQVAASTINLESSIQEMSRKTDNGESTTPGGSSNTAPVKINEPYFSDTFCLTDIDPADGPEVYDTDGIVVNFPYGYNISQIAAAEWYRNDTQMTNVGDCDFVLTNNEMKTFTGIPTEYTPASSHTDHAIMGYKYTVKLFDKLGNLITTLSVSVKSSFKYYGPVFAHIGDNWAKDVRRMSPYELRSYFQNLKEDGFDGVSFVYATIMNSPTDNNVVIQSTPDKSINSWGQITQSSSDLEKLLTAINDVGGLDVEVRGCIFISDIWQKSNGNAFNAHINPKDISLFMKNYGDLWVELATLFEKFNVDEITPFIEASGIAKHPDEIKAMYSRLSEVFSGEIAFEEDTGNILNGVDPFQRVKSYDSNAGKFWDWKDAQGRPMVVQFSTWGARYDSQKDQRYSLMADNYIKFLSPAFEYYKTNYPNNPIEFGEYGARHGDGVCIGQDFWEIDRKILDHQEFADTTAANFKAMKQLNPRKAMLCVVAFQKYGEDLPTYTNMEPGSVVYDLVASIISDN